MIKIHLLDFFPTKETLFKYIKFHNDNYRKNRIFTRDLDYYRKLIEMRNSAIQYSDIFANDSYIHQAYITLPEWNMQQRGAKLVDEKTFISSIRLQKDILIKLSRYCLEKLNSEEINKILVDTDLLFQNLQVMATKARIVGVSKTLHFFLPHLIMPIDRENVLYYLYQTKNSPTNPEKELSWFKEIFVEYSTYCNVIHLTKKDVDGIGWNTSIPKLIDNAIIGWFAMEIAPRVKELC